MPKQFGKLKNLQVLDLFYVGEGSKCNIEELGELNNLHGTLQIMKLQNVVNPLDALAANMKTKKHLVKLMLEWGEKHDDSEKEKEVLEKLQPSKHLKELSIWKYGGKQFPDWFGDNSLLSNVVSLELSDCKYCTLLPTLGLLPSLKKLWINGFPRIQMIGREFYGNGTSSFTTIPFPSLKSLTFSSMKGWEEWECQVVKGAFPRLQELCIYSCPKLKALPPLGLLPSLNKLKISGLHGIKVIGREFYENETSSSSTISFPFLKTLTFYDMEGWEEWECHTVTGAFPCLQELSITNCTKLKGELPEQLPCLMELEISNCLELVASIPWAGGRCMEGSSLKALKITDGPTINIPLSQCYNFLETLHISGGSCDSLRTFPLDIFPMLHQLHLEKCSNLEMISQEHSQTSSLRKLRIEKCPKFISFPRGGLSSPRLESFHIIKLICHGKKLLYVVWEAVLNFIFQAYNKQDLQYTGKDNLVKLWHAKIGRELYSLHETPKVEISKDHDNNMWDLAWHPIGNPPSVQVSLILLSVIASSHAEQNPITGLVGGILPLVDSKWWYHSKCWSCNALIVMGQGLLGASCWIMNNLSREILETLTELSDLGFLNSFWYQLAHRKLPTNIGTLHHLESITFHATISMVKYLQAWLQ
ncbi:Leucine-rich repeat domain superfamily [Sesbania bispinosa]|nr:Leucine-rich repeat domain superfamily [Sesbania bispinosa]